MAAVVVPESCRQRKNGEAPYAALSTLKYNVEGQSPKNKLKRMNTLIQWMMFAPTVLLAIFGIFCYIHRSFEKVPFRVPSSALNLFSSAEAHSREMRWEQAIEAYRHGLDLTEKSNEDTKMTMDVARHYVALADSLRNLGRTQAAMEELGRALAILNPSPTLSLSSTPSSERGVEATVAAALPRWRGVERNARIQLGDLLLEAGKPGPAEFELRVALLLQQQQQQQTGYGIERGASPRLLLLLGQALVAQGEGRWEEALLLLRRAAQGAPADAQAKLALASLLRRCGVERGSQQLMSEARAAAADAGRLGHHRAGMSRGDAGRVGEGR